MTLLQPLCLTNARIPKPRPLWLAPHLWPAPLAAPFCCLAARVISAHSKVINAMEERPKVVLPIFATKPDGGVDLIGSGILLRARNVELLVTAAHVLALKASNTLCVPIGGTNYWALNQSFTISSESLEGAQNESPAGSWLHGINHSAPRPADAGWLELPSRVPGLVHN
jgi:hypothetical protein